MKAALFCLVLLGVAQMGLAHSDDASTDVETTTPFKNARMLDYCSGVCVYDGTVKDRANYYYSGYLYDNAEAWFDVVIGTAKKDTRYTISTSYYVTIEFYLKKQDGSLERLQASQYGTSNYGRLLIPASSDSDRKLLVKVKNGQNNYNSYYYYYGYNYISYALDVLNSEEVPAGSDNNDNSHGSRRWAVPITIVLAVILLLFIVGCIVMRIRNKRSQQRQRTQGAVSPSSIPTAYQLVQQPAQHYPNSEFPFHPYHYAPVGQAPTYVVPGYPQPAAAAPVQVTVHAGAQGDDMQPPRPAGYPHLPPINNRRY